MLKKYRKYLNLSVEFVARQVNLSVPTVLALESGLRPMSMYEKSRFAKLYGVSLSSLEDECDVRQYVYHSPCFSKLSDEDKQVVIRLTIFKRNYIFA